MTKELIAKLEDLEAPNKEVFREVFLAVCPIPYGGAAYGRWMALEPEFEVKIKCQAWESAAIMLVPEGYAWGMDARHCSAILTRLSAFEHEFAQHPAIALLICILKAKEPVK